VLNGPNADKLEGDEREWTEGGKKGEADRTLCKIIHGKQYSLTKCNAGTELERKSNNGSVATSEDMPSTARPSYKARRLGLKARKKASDMKVQKRSLN